MGERCFAAFASGSVDVSEGVGTCERRMESCRAQAANVNVNEVGCTKPGAEV